MKLGVLDRERKEFWRFLTHTLIKNRERLAESLRRRRWVITFAS
jgi:hypothetical protein